MKPIELNGIFPPIPTPFINEKVAYDKLAANIERWNPTGLKGFVVLGSNGEYNALSEEEKRAVVDTVVQSAADEMLVIAGTGCESTVETVRLTEDCAKLGADAALVVTPHYYGGRMNEAALINYYSTVADQSPIPILLYNVPKFTHINMAANLIARLSEHPNIIGLKDSAGNVIQLGEIINAVAKDFNVLVGTAGVLYSGLTIDIHLIVKDDNKVVSAMTIIIAARKRAGFDHDQPAFIALQQPVPAGGHCGEGLLAGKRCDHNIRRFGHLAAAVGRPPAGFLQRFQRRRQNVIADDRIVGPEKMFGHRRTH